MNVGEGLLMFVNVRKSIHVCVLVRERDSVKKYVGERYFIAVF